MVAPEAFYTALHSTWNDMWGLKLPVLEKILRPIVVYLALVVLLRLFGKRELAQLNPFDLVVLLSISNTVQNAIIGDDNSVAGGLIGAVSLFGINYVVVRFLFRHRRLDQVLEGSATTLMRGGNIDRNALAKEMLSESELLTVARKQGFDSLQEVETCVLEPGGAFFLKGRVPSSDSERFSEMMKRLDEIDRKLNTMATASGK